MIHGNFQLPAGLLTTQVPANYVGWLYHYTMYLVHHQYLPGGQKAADIIADYCRWHGHPAPEFKPMTEADIHRHEGGMRDAKR